MHVYRSKTYIFLERIKKFYEQKQNLDKTRDFGLLHYPIRIDNIKFCNWCNDWIFMQMKEALYKSSKLSQKFGATTVIALLHFCKTSLGEEEEEVTSSPKAIKT